MAQISGESSFSFLRWSQSRWIPSQLKKNIVSYSFTFQSNKEGRSFVLYLDSSPRVVWQEIYRWCTWLDRIPQKEIQLCGVYVIIHHQNLETQQTGRTSKQCSFSIQHFSFLTQFIRSKSDSEGVLKTVRQAFHDGTWKVSWAMYVSLSHSNSPLVVYWKMEEVMLSIRLGTRCFRSLPGSAFRIAFWKMALNAWGCTQ